MLVCEVIYTPYMERKNIEIKAICSDLNAARQILIDNSANLIGVDKQTDTYFRVPKGKLKFREASLTFESGLIFYDREKKTGPKYSQITFYQPSKEKTLLEILNKSLEIETVVIKKREHFMIDNVRFHLDTVDSLGEFIEIEAQDTHEFLSKEILVKQCQFYAKMLKIKRSNLTTKSYSDLILQKQ